MISVQKLLFLLIFFNISVLIGFHIIGRHNIANITTDDLGLLDDWPGQDAPPPTKQDTKIENPFKLLGAYEKVDPVYFNRGDEPEELYKKITYGLINDDDYCDKVDMYYLAHPEKMMQNKNFFTDYPWRTVPRIAIEKAGTVSMTHISNLMAKKAAGKSQYHLDTTINNFYTIMGGFHQHHEINKHFLCQTQMYNHIPGNGVMYRKDLVLDKILAYKQKFQDRPECFNQSEFFLPFYRLFKKEECQAFFEIINSDDYKVALEKTPVQYLIKQGHGAHKSTGVFLLDEDETTLLMEKYQNGLRCGEETESLIAQKYITNPLLLDKQNKFDFRIYMLIASTNPAIVYYHDGYLRVSVETFDMNSKDRGTHLTNTYLAEKKFAEARKENKTINGMTAKEMEEYHLWDFARFQDYLLASGKVTDKNWLDNYLRPQFKKAFTHLIKMSSDGFWKQSNVYELHGLDFMLDDDMNLWFIESNPNPLLIGVKPNLISQMLADMFEIQYAYYRSRMKRLVGLIRWMQDEAEEVGRDGLDLDMWKEEYALAVKNKLEPEYRLKATNTFTLVMDESKPKEEAYLGRIPGECFSE